jgi:ferredoxin
MSTYKLTLKPTGVVLDIEEGKNVLELLREKDIYIKSSCGGHATCNDCIIKIVSGEDNLSPSPFPELKLLGNVFHITKERMACQLSVTGDVTIDISKHDKESDERKTSSKKNIMKKVVPVRVRKEQEVIEIKTDRAAFREQRSNTTEEWQKHWEKTPTKASEKSKAKNLGGNKPPKYFNTEKIDYEKTDYTRPLPENKKLEKIEKIEKEKAAKAAATSDKEFTGFRDNNKDKK